MLFVYGLPKCLAGYLNLLTHEELLANAWDETPCGKDSNLPGQQTNKNPELAFVSSPF